MKRLFFTTVLVSGFITWLFFNGDSPERRGQEESAQASAGSAVPSTESKSRSPTEVLRSHLTALPRWTPACAAAVADALEPCAEWILSNQSWLKQAGGIQMEGSVPKLLENYPSSITLLMMAHADARSALAEGILSGPNAAAQELLLSSCAKYVDATSLSLWAQALKAQGPTIASLLKICPTWPVDGIFAFDRGSPIDGAAQEVASLYDRWVVDALQVPEDELASMVQFLLEAAPSVRARLRSDSQFRNQFQDTWANFKECIRDTQKRLKGVAVWHCFGDDPKLWDLLMRKNGKELFKNAGSLATKMLFGDHAVQGKEAQDRVEHLLLAQYAEIYNAMERLGENSAFQTVITRDILTDDQIAIACSRLNQARQKSPDGDVALLNKWMSQADDAELKHLATGSEAPNCLRKVAGYSFINSAIKLTNGRRITAEDVASMTYDAYRIAEAYATGGKTVIGGLKAVGQQAVQDFVTGLPQDAEEYGPDLIARAINGPEVSRLTMYGALKLQPDEVRKRLQLNEAMDVTSATQAASLSGPTRYAFDKCMKMGAQFKLAAPSTHLIVNLNADTVSVDALAIQVRETASRVEMEASSLMAWQQNLAAWWLYAWSIK